MCDFEYLNSKLNEDFIEAFNNMQDKYITNEKYRLNFNEINGKLAIIKDVLINYNL